MADGGSPEYSTLVIAALLILALMFAGAWINAYASPGSDAGYLWPWFGGVATVIVVGGIAWYLVGWRR